VKRFYAEFGFYWDGIGHVIKTSKTLTTSRVTG